MKFKRGINLPEFTRFWMTENFKRKKCLKNQIVECQKTYERKKQGGVKKLIQGRASMLVLFICCGKVLIFETF